jgi:chromosome segregation ATPase
VGNRNGLLSSSLTPSSIGSSSADEQHPPPLSSHEQASNKERELQKQLDAACRELEQERRRLWSCEAQMQLTLADVEREVGEYKHQLEMVALSLENEYRDWERVRGRLESQVERERLKVRARDVQIHELKLSKEQETAGLSCQLSTLRHQLESENRELREHHAKRDVVVCTQPTQ